MPACAYTCLSLHLPVPIPALACTCPCLYLPKPVPARAYTYLSLYLPMPIPASACTCPCLYLPQPVPAHAYTCLRLYLSKVVPTLGCTHRWSVMGGNRPCSDGGLVVRGKTCSFMPPSASFSSKSWDTCRWFWKHTCKVSRGCIASYLHHRKCQWLDRNSRIRALAHHLQQTSRHLSTQLSNRFPNTYQ